MGTIFCLLKTVVKTLLETSLTCFVAQLLVSTVFDPYATLTLILWLVTDPFLFEHKMLLFMVQNEVFTLAYGQLGLVHFPGNHAQLFAQVLTKEFTVVLKCAVLTLLILPYSLFYCFLFLLFFSQII